MKKVLCMLLAAAMSAAMLTGCGNSSASPASNSASPAAGSTAGTTSSGKKVLRVAAVDPQVPLDMQKNTYSLIMKITDNITESLLTTNNDGVLEPTLLVELPKLSDDKLTYSFELKKGIKFHNGETVTSSDVKYSLERMVKLKKMGSLLSKVVGFDEMESEKAKEISGIQVTDDTHFTIKLKEPYTPFTSALSTPYCAIYPKAACEAAGESWGKTTLFGTGPFKLVSYTTGTGVELSRFDEYHGTKAKLDGISYKFIEDVNTQVLEYQKGNVDYIDLDTSLYPVYSSNATLSKEMHSFQPVGGYYFNFNAKTIKDPKVREAISLSIDRKSICDSILHGTASPAASFIPKGLIGHDDSLQAYEYNPEKAKSLLKEAGYANGYDLRVTVNTKYSVSVAVATTFQEQAKAAGINVKIEQVDSAAWTDMKHAGGVDCGIGNWYVDYNDPDSMLYPVSDERTDLTSSFWHNNKFKELMQQGVKTDDKDARQKIYAEAEQVLTRQDYAVAPIYNETKYYLLKPNVTGFEIKSTFRTFFVNADIQ